MSVIKIGDRGDVMPAAGVLPLPFAGFALTVRQVVPGSSFTAGAHYYSILNFDPGRFTDDLHSL